MRGIFPAGVFPGVEDEQHDRSETDRDEDRKRALVQAGELFGRREAAVWAECSVAHRLDRLGAVKDVAQAASVPVDQ